MKTTIKMSLILALMLCIFVGCEIMKGPDFYFKTYIGRYAPADSVSVSVVKPGVLNLQFISRRGENGKTYYDIDQEEWHARHNDYDYNRYIKQGDLNGQIEAAAIEIASIEVYSDKAFDANHEAGASLNDIVRFYSANPLPYIESRYTSTYKYDKAYLEELSKVLGGTCKNTWDYSLRPVDAFICDLKPEELRILLMRPITNVGAHAMVVLPEPQGDKNHEITLRIVAVDGDILVTKTKMQW